MILSSTEWLHRISQVIAYKVRSQTNFVRVCLNIALRNFEMFLLIGIYELVCHSKNKEAVLYLPIKGLSPVYFLIISLSSCRDVMFADLCIAKLCLC